MIIYIEENIPFLTQSLANCGQIISFKGRDLKRQDLIDSGCDALIVRSTTFANGKLLDGTNVKFLGTATSGIDHIDSDYLKKQNIFFSHALGSNANSVAEYVVYSILKWADEKDISLASKSLGIIGYGNIGKLVAKYANYMGLQVLINDPPLFEGGEIFPDYVRHLQLEELIKRSSIITNHVPLTTAGKYPTQNLLNQTLINQIQCESLFIHASRGGVVEEKPLLEKLEEGSLTAVVDVWLGEPFANRSLAFLSLIATPHIAGYSMNGKLKGALMIAKDFETFFGIKPDAKNIKDVLSGYNPLPAIDFKKHKVLLAKLKKTREFEYDHELFIESLKLSDEKSMELFDLQRKCYPVRREIL